MVIYTAGVEAVTLSSTLPYEGNSITVCPSSNVILTCMVAQQAIYSEVGGCARTFRTVLRIPEDIDRDSDTLQ